MKERPICRSHPIKAKIEKMETDLDEACSSGDFTKLHSNLSSCSGTDIKTELRHRAEVLHHKLEQQLKIQNFLQSKTHHDNYKDIRKDVKKINDMVAEAQELNIELD